MTNRITADRIRLKRAYEHPATGDGLRILVDRLWPRGVSKADAALDQWAKDLAPTTSLRKWFAHDPKRWDEFQHRYAVELRQHADELKQLRTQARKAPITLVYSAHDEVSRPVMGHNGHDGRRCTPRSRGLVARDVPVVLPRAHDCVTIFLGARDRYQAEHEATPGTYWYVQDQMDRGNDLKGWLLGDAARSDDVIATRAEYVERFGADNADYLMETLGEWRTRYERGAFLDTGLAPADPAAARAREEAERRGWRFERKLADLQLVRRLLYGEWDGDFQVLQPGERLAMSYDAEVVRVDQAGTANRPDR